MKRRIIVGIDEAGRGPIIGPLIVAGIALWEDNIGYLSSIGVRDSKQLSPQRRLELASRVMEVAAHIVIVEVGPEIIDYINLNTIEYDSVALVIARILESWRERVSKIIVDSIGPVPKAYNAILRMIVGMLGASKENLVEIAKKVLSVEEKADQYHVATSAASIIAKVIRDERIRSLREKYGVEGSGYPTDPRTIAWLRRVYSENPSTPPPFVRRTWSTLKSIAPSWYQGKKSSLSRGSHGKTLLDYLNSGA